MLLHVPSLSSQGRFRQVEVFQQVTTAFLRAPQRSDLPPEALARRRHAAAWFRRLARKSLSQTHDRNAQNTTLPTAGSSPCGPPPYSLPSKIPQEELTPDREEMLDCSRVATELNPLEEVLAVAESSARVFILHNLRPHTLSSPFFSSSSFSQTSPADISALLAPPPPSLGCLWSVDGPPSPARRLSSPDGNYLEIPALMSHDSSPSLAVTSSSVRPAALIGGFGTENPPPPSAHPRDAAFPKVSASASTLHPRTSFPALPEMSSLSDPPSGNVWSSESEVMSRASGGNPASAAGRQESARAQSAASVAYYSVSNFCSPSVLPPLHKPFLRQSTENTAHQVLVGGSDSRPPSAPVAYQSGPDLPDHHHNVTEPQKDSGLQADMKQEGSGVNHNDVTQTVDLHTKSCDSPSEASAVVSEEEPELLTASEKQSSTNAKVKEPNCVSSGSVRSESNSVQEPRDSPDVPNWATPTQTPSGVLDVTEESSCDPDTDSWLDGPAGEGEGGDALLSAVLEQADTEGLVYWAEPIQVSVCSPVGDDPSGREAAADSAHFTSPPDESSHSPRPQFVENEAALFSATPSSFILNPLTFPSAAASLKFSSCSLPSSLSSHIAHRRDVPFAARSNSAVLSGLFALDTSTPFRAVQSWTELQIQRRTATRAAQSTARRPHDEVHRGRGGDGVKVWRRRTQTAARDCVCGHQCTAGNQEGASERQEVGSISVRESKVSTHSPSSRLSTAPCVSSPQSSMAELQEMSRCLRHYCSVFSSLEEQLGEEQAESYQLLSEQDRWVAALRADLHWCTTTMRRKQHFKIFNIKGVNMTEENVCM